jgi:uncharacterized pyridoxal phosphate-containing UPF0001 family protein
MSAGLSECGENRVAELAGKVEEVGRDAVHWHLIGHLQRNKASAAIGLFDLIHSIDSLRLAKQLSNDAWNAGVTVRGLVQVNTSGEASKSGIDVADDADIAAAVEAAHEISELPNIEIHGLMTMAPLVDDEKILRTNVRAHSEASRSMQ